MRALSFAPRAAIAGVALAALAQSGPAAMAQTMTPMLGQVRSVSDHFGIRVTPANPHSRRLRLVVRVYDERFRPVRARVRPASFDLAPGAQRSVHVLVPFEGTSRRKVRICTETLPQPHQDLTMRLRICGRFLASRLR